MSKENKNRKYDKQRDSKADKAYIAGKRHEVNKVRSIAKRRREEVAHRAKVRRWAVRNGARLDVVATCAECRAAVRAVRGR